ncbi:putative Glycosyl transferase, group 1 [Vibrio nigripulchritudo SOn1]|uniref:Glycosyl transferase, group 1 n=1 Tax=Vibrio nigripulchritudo SOn1 TaxID=1238450 RepID=A0AAV2VUE4_9VIBR|nr:glycosyltransferase [Vibrio nigripulchritudo]CCO48252.1 putative Glycosyl transferase, group 1 [Vibrio nigripulchritudo SOn1]
MKVAIFGIYPPPYGGISVHIKRVMKKLLEKGDEVTVYNQGLYFNVSQNIQSIPLKKMLFSIFFNDFDILHFHNTNRSLKSLLLLMKLFRNKVILTSHGDSLVNQLNEANHLFRVWMIINLKSIDKIICVNPETANTLSTIGIKNTCISPAYINPVECQNDIENISNIVWDFISDAEFLISANGAVRFYNEEDLYGLDLMIDCMETYIGSKVKLIFCVLSVTEQSEKEKEYYQRLKKKVIDLDLMNNVLLYEVSNSEFYPILKSSHLFVRPTNNDGYGVSIAEAIYYNVPAIATDVCRRPEGTILVKNRCVVSLKQKIQYVLEHYNLEKERVSLIDVPDNFKELYNIYESLSGNK